MSAVCKVLFIGSGNISPINILCKNLLDHGRVKYVFDGLNMYDYGYTEKNPYLYLTNKYTIVAKFDNTKWRKTFSALPKERKIELIKRIIKSCFLFRFKMGYGFFKSELKFWSYILDITKLASQYDIVNVQYLHDWSAELVSFLPERIKVIVSFWGSDLMASAGVKSYELQYNALKRADKVTVFSNESSEILLSKFGRDLKKKSFQVFYGFTTEQYLNLSNDTEKYYQIANELIKRYGYNLNNFKFVIKVGYSSFPNQNHIEILNQIKNLPLEILDQCLFILPMTYGDLENYPLQIEKIVKAMSINCIILKNYLSSEEAKSLSFGCNVMFNLRGNDGFNNSMLESLMAGAVVINGSWLPYSLLQQYNIYTIEICSILDLSSVLLEVMEDFDTHLNNSRDNRLKLRELVGGEATAKKWESVFLD